MSTTFPKLRRPLLWIGLAWLAAGVLVVLTLAAVLHGASHPEFRLIVDGETVHVGGLDADSLPVVLGVLSVVLVACVVLLPLGLLLLIGLLTAVFVVVALAVLVPLTLALLPVFALLGLPLVGAFFLARWLWRRSAARPASGTTIDA